LYTAKGKGDKNGEMYVKRNTEMGKRDGMKGNGDEVGYRLVEAVILLKIFSFRNEIN
jgi:hypothetical protein